MSRIFIILFFLFSNSALSQITITQSTIPLSGVAYNQLHGPHGSGEIDNGEPGPNQTWSFGDFAWEDEELMEIENPAESPLFADFPTANRMVAFPAEARHGEGTFYFERIADSGYFVLGFGNITDVDTMAYPYQAEAFHCPMPLTYPAGDWTLVRRWSFNSGGGDSVVVVDSIVNTVDGWGTLTTPFGNFQVLRIFHHDWLFTIFTGTPPVEIQQVGYRWIDEACVTRADVTSEADVTDPDFEHGHLHLTQDAVNTVPRDRGPVAQNFSVRQNYPNPFNPSTLLPLSMQQAGEVSLKIYNENGQLVSEEKFSFSPGQYNLPINGSQWSTGTYFAEVSTNGSSQITKMQLVK